MTHSGLYFQSGLVIDAYVLIPLLLDDPLWAESIDSTKEAYLVLIPLLLDDPLWVLKKREARSLEKGLNPSFAG